MLESSEMEKDRFSRTFPLRGTIPFIIVSIIPIAMALVPCIWDGNGIALPVVAAFLSDPATQMMLGISIGLSLFCAVVASWLGNAGAKLIVTNRFAGKRFCRTIFRLPAAISPVVAVTGYLVLFGKDGLVDKPIKALAALIPAPFASYLPLAGAAFVMIASCAPIVASIVGSSWENLDYRCEQAALTLGSPWKTVYRTITKPRLAASRKKATALAFLNCVTAFACIAVLCRDVPVFTLATGMQELENAGYHAACATLALVSVDISVLVLALFCSSDTKENLKSYQNNNHAWEASGKIPALRKLWIFICMTLSALVILGPILAVVARSFISDGSFSVQGYVELFNGLDGTGTKAVIFSLAIALASSLVASSISTRVCSRCLRDKMSPIGLYLLPWACGPVVVAVGFSQIQRLLSLTGLTIPAIILVVLADIAISVPVCVLFSVSGFRNLSDSLSACSRTLGFNSRETFRTIEKPNLIHGIRAGFCMSFAISLGNLEIPLIIGGPETKTLPVQLYGLLSNGAIQEACALGSTLVLICLILFLTGTKQERKHHA